MSHGHFSDLQFQAASCRLIVVLILDGLDKVHSLVAAVSALGFFYIKIVRTKGHNPIKPWFNLKGIHLVYLHL